MAKVSTPAYFLLLFVRSLSVAQSETLDERLVAVEVAVFEVLEKLASLTYHDKESAA